MIINSEHATTSFCNNETLDSFDGFYPSFIAAMNSPHQSEETQREPRELVRRYDTLGDTAVNLLAFRDGRHWFFVPFSRTDFVTRGFAISRVTRASSAASDLLFLGTH
jgi:hypothetical protein